MRALATDVVPYAYAKGRLRLLDQRRLPHEEVYLECESALETAEAIRALAVRGAPLIGVAAAYGVAAEATRVAARSAGDLDAALEAACDRLASARPTAVNLGRAVERMRRVVHDTATLPVDERLELLEREACLIAEEDEAACRAIGEHGAHWLLERLPLTRVTLLTHCNAGALATAGIGTALGVVRALARERTLTVLADETRPFLQGARLTAWELMKDGIDVTLLPDVAAASVIASGSVDVVVVGADRIAANGDVANKVGTYGVALACRAHGVPFVVAAPTTTLDASTPDGRSIPIESRDAGEVLEVSGGGAVVRIAPPGARAFYPAFDVTPAALVDAIVTEKGVSTRPHEKAIAAWSRREGEER
ncbi:MAG TPA: S-methyl-5-thioribose-1-phosphate isomerase [Thermoanaerobaculia bacterium]|nr:S-methyl-5-thioribose-1-phosphate isomerase [Thermoanaerobaculia bacterium]